MPRNPWPAILAAVLILFVYIWLVSMEAQASAQAEALADMAARLEVMEQRYEAAMKGDYRYGGTA